MGFFKSIGSYCTTILFVAGSRVWFFNISFLAFGRRATGPPGFT